VTNTARNDRKKLRNMAAIIATLSGAAQCLALWLLPVSPAALMTAFLGTLYLLLALGLFGISSFSLILAIVVLPLRSWFGLYPLGLEAWELIRIAGDLAIATLCVPVLWAMLDPTYRKVEPGAANAGQRTMTEPHDV
jgi:hypothetical protein